MISPSTGMPVSLSTWLLDGQMCRIGNAILVGTYIDAEMESTRQNRNAARAIVREEMADVLEWLGTTVPDVRTHQDVLRSLGFSRDDYMLAHS